MSYSNDESAGGSSPSLLSRIPGGWYIGIMMAAGAALGFFVQGTSAVTAWFMAVVAVLAFASPWLT